MEENQSTEDIKNEPVTENMDEKESETSDVALTDVFLNTTNQDGCSLLPDKASVEDLSEDQLLSSDTKPSDMLANDTFDKEQFEEELPSDTNKDTSTVLQEESDEPLMDTTAPPEESSSSAETNRKEEKSEMSSSTENNSKEENSEEKSSSAENDTKEENNEEKPSLAENDTKEENNEEKSSSVENDTKEENNEEKSSSASVENTTPSQKYNELEGDKVTKTALSDSLPSKPSVPRKVPFALKNKISMDTSTTQQSEENESLIVHVDDTQNDLDADLVTSKDKVSGKTVVKKTDGSTVEERAKGKTEGGQTEKKADEKKDDKDVKSKSSSVSKPKVIKNIKSNDQNSRNLWVSGLATTTRATDLKMLFTKYGKVVGAKVVTNARSPGARCYGFVTMSSSHEASKCIQHLNQTELHGRMISVERAKKEPSTKAPETKPGEKKVEKTEVKKDEKKDGDKKDGVKKVEKKDDKSRRTTSRRDNKRYSSRSSSSRHKSSDKSHTTTPNKSTAKPATKEGSEKSAGPAAGTASTKEKVSGAPKPKPRGPSASSAKKDILSFDQIKERERQRSRQRQRSRREQERRRVKNLGLARMRQQDVGWKQKEEAKRLDKVREKIRLEQMKLEKMKLEKEKLLRYRMEKELLEIERRNVEMRSADMLRLERMKLEKMKMEKEKLLRYRMEKELFEMERRDAEMLRLEEMRHPPKRPHDRNRLRDEELWDDRKRTRMSSSGNPSRFELPFQNESRMPFELRRDMGPSGEPDRRYVGPDRGHDNDRQNLSAHNRLGRMRNSFGGGPDQRPWGSGSVDRKVDNWSHMHGDRDQANEPWHGNPMTKTGRDATGAFVDNTRPGNSGGMGQNLGPGNMFGNSQSHGRIMMVTHGSGGSGGGGGSSSNNMSGRIQEPRFDAYNIMGSM